MPRRITPFLLLALAACATSSSYPDEVAARLAAPPAPDFVLIGEQHDAPLHRRAEQRVIEVLAARRQLAGVVIEMADRGHSTSALSRDAAESAVQAALGWDDAGWPWKDYRQPVMAAVHAGVPVSGGNLPRPALAPAMADATIDGAVAEPILQAQREAVRSGHCGLLPESQLTPMARIQVARDRSLAQALSQAATPGKTVILIAGGQHADPELGVPQHLPRTFVVRSERLEAQEPQKDYCEELRQHFGRQRPRQP